MMSLSKRSAMDDILARKAVTDQDVARLRRAYYADGIIDPEEAVTLFQIHRTCTTKGATWADCFIEMLTDYVVNQIAPEGSVTVENADWLIGRVAETGRIADRTEFELVVNVIDKARWSPERLVTFALGQVRDLVLDRNGDLGPVSNQPTVSEGDVELLRRVLYAFGGDGNIAITRAEAEILFEIDAATEDADNAEGWQALFVKCIANCVLSASGYTVPSREEALAREAWLDRRGDLSIGNVLAGMMASYRVQSREEQAIARLERQKIEIVTGEGVSVAEAQWLADRITANGSLGANEIALIDMLRQAQPNLHPVLSDLVERHAKAA
jgi:hypothetical protein